MKSITVTIKIPADILSKMNGAVEDYIDNCIMDAADIHYMDFAKIVPTKERRALSKQLTAQVEKALVKVATSILQEEVECLSADFVPDEFHEFSFIDTAAEEFSTKLKLREQNKQNEHARRLKELKEQASKLGYIVVEQ